MRVKIGLEPVWVNTFPQVGGGDRPPTVVPISLEITERLPKGKYTVQVILTGGPDSEERLAKAELEIRHAG